MMRLVKIAVVFFIVFGISQSLYAFSKIYLLPEVEKSGADLKLSDIAIIEGKDSGLLSNIDISGIAEKKGLIDKREIHGIITDMGFSGFVIYGNGVRISNNKITEVFLKPEKDFIIQKGDPVKISVIKNGITVELQGKSLSSVSIGEGVKVRVNKNRVLTGTAASKGQVFLELK
ncbi:MAG: flagella basal body P-ring formation protein FlgA [Spirochaetota bacterium]